MRVPIKKRNQTGSGGRLLGFLNTGQTFPTGYTRLTDCPEIRACIDAYAAPISAATIYLMQNNAGGDRRIKTELSRRIDIDPCPNFGSRQTLMDWIVVQMLTDRDGSAFVLPRTKGGRLERLEPMPDAVMIDDFNARTYRVHWRGLDLAPDEILHFRASSSPSCPWRGRGFLASARQIAESLASTDALKKALSSPQYKPPILVAVSTDSPLSNPKERDKFRSQYLEDGDGKPWVIPSDLMTVETLKPLSLNDMAVKDTLELDKRSAASLFGVPPFLLGLGSFSREEYNLFIGSKVEKLAVAIEKELTAKLVENDREYFQFNRRRLYSFDLRTLMDIDLAMADRGYLNGDEVRVDAMLDPVGLTERTRLENFIPTDMAGKQKKLDGTSDSEEEET